LQGADYTNCVVWGNAPFQGVDTAPQAWLRARIRLVCAFFRKAAVHEPEII
jgi:hypothetical protein